MPAADVFRYTATTAAAREGEVRTAARNSRRWSRELSAEAAGRWAVRVPRRLHEQIAELPAADPPG